MQPIYFITYEKDDGFLNIDSAIIKNAREKKYTPKFIKGYSLKQHPEIKKTQLVYLNFLHKAIPFLMKRKAYGFLYAEDDAIINIPSNELTEIINKNGKDNILWIGYQKILRKKGEIDYVVGGQLLYIPKSRLEHLKVVLNNTRPQHMDRFLLNKRQQIGLKLVPQNLKKIYSKSNPDGKLVSEMTSQSATTGKVRKGVNLQPLGRDIKIINRQSKSQ